ncbi:nodulation protein NfeD [Oleiagrimonas sp. C23AA]|uniref:NfeD family protein n=1 Tax=Oleiagrimonas sp. C23AA TaxID=2719047 RepID=UPI001F0CE368|nr:nodulation protein NfeD [Oleiagrimonas sp. C23AA]
MKATLRRLLAVLAVMLSVGGVSVIASPVSAPTDSAGFAARIRIDGAIGPAMAEYMQRALRQAQADGARVVVLELDTPGGLSSSMRHMISAVLASPLPVIGYVAPGGARAASAGTYLLYACPLAAMAPTTHLGAATPIRMGARTPMPDASEAASSSTAAKPSADAEQTKTANDAVAYIRSLAQRHGRNAAWAEKAVRGAATLTADEALRANVINLLADNAQQLLAKADGRKVALASGTVTLHTAGLSVRDYAPGWRSRFLGVITNPTIAYLLLLAGIYGLVLEGFHPGAMLPGIAGGIALLIGLYALQMLPVDYAGLALMALGVALVIGEVLSAGIGAMGVGGVIAFVLGSIMLFDRDVPGFGVDVGVIAGIAVCAIATLGAIIWFVVRARHRRKASGDDVLLDARGPLLQALPAGGQSWAMIRGERWRVTGDAALAAGAEVRVLARDGLVLRVEAA